MSTRPKVQPPPAAIRLSPTSYLVLGLIGLRGASTPYDLKRAISRSVSYFWPFPHSQLYSEPERLVATGLLSRKDENGGRHRKLYSLTKEGHRALQDWVKSPPGEIFEMRDIAVLQLFFSEFMSEDDLVALALNQGRLYRERLATYQGIARTAGEDRIKRRRMASVHLGIRMMKACIDFWDDVAKNPPEP
jgi:PadR family transcriptional regulator, regulatory protein AphA